MRKGGQPSATGSAARSLPPAGGRCIISTSQARAAVRRPRGCRLDFGPDKSPCSGPAFAAAWSAALLGLQDEAAALVEVDAAGSTSSRPVRGTLTARSKT